MSVWLRQLKADFLHAAMSAGYVAVGGFAAYAQEPLARVLTLAVLAAISFPVWLAAYRRYRLVADTPSSRVASASQGYVELVGRSDVHPGSQTLGYSALPPCVWYRYWVEREQDGGGSVQVDSGRSDDTFLLVDDSGHCVIDPDQAEIDTTHRSTWNQGGYRHRAEFLRPDDTLYALGELVTLGGAAAPLDRGADVSALLARWKRDRQLLLARFDRDGDGEIDLEEWASARQAAEQEVDAQHRQIRLQPGVHLLRAPADGRPFLLSNRDPRRLMRRYHWWAWFHLGVFVLAALVALYWLGRLAV